MNIYLLIIIILSIIISSRYYIGMFNNNRIINQKIQKSLIDIQNFLNDKNEIIQFTSNKINIHGKYDTNFKVSLYNYLEYNGIFDNEAIKKEINQLFLISDISLKDINNLIDIILLVNDQINTYIEND